MCVVDAVLVVLTEEQAAELRAVVNSRDVSAVVATRARIVLWMAEGRRRTDVGELAGVSLPTVDRWVERGDGPLPHANRGRVGVLALRGEAVARQRSATAPARHVQALAGSEVRGEGRRRGRY